ncbi:MAG: hypothetical protein ACOC7V_02770 [Spirochaetota bacterium]
MRTLTILIAVMAAVFMLASCGSDAEAPTGFVPDQSVEAYAYVHGGYVGQVVATTDDEGEFSVTIDEAFLPHTLAIVDIEADEWNEDNTVFYVQRGNEVRVAKWISYAGTNYTGVTVGSALAYVESDEDGNPSGSTILEKSILRNEESIASWWDSIADGAFQVYTEFGGSGSAVTTTSYGSLYKRGSEYWADRGLTWQGNMEAIEEAAEEYGIAYALDEMARNNDNEWELADATTGATASDFKDYFSLVQLAVARLEMQ